MFGVLRAVTGKDKGGCGGEYRLYAVVEQQPHNDTPVVLCGPRRAWIGVRVGVRVGVEIRVWV